LAGVVPQSDPARLALSCRDSGVPLARGSPPNHCQPGLCNYTGAIIDSTEGTYRVGSSGTLEFVGTHGAFGSWADVNDTESMSQGPVTVHYS